ncbi:9689_t:CDS:2, partial [Funneliformis mosseae]
MSLVLEINSYFDNTPVLEWSYHGFLNALKPYFISDQNSIENLNSIIRKRYLAYLKNFLDVKEKQGLQIGHYDEHYDFVTLLLRQGFRSSLIPSRGGCRSSRFVRLLLGCTWGARRVHVGCRSLRVFCAFLRVPYAFLARSLRKEPETQKFWKIVEQERDLENEFENKKIIVKRKLQIDGLDLVHVSRQQQNFELVSELNSEIRKKPRFKVGADASQSSESIGIGARSSNDVISLRDDRPSTPTHQIYSTTTNQDILDRLLKEKQRAKST